MLFAAVAEGEFKRKVLLTHKQLSEKRRAGRRWEHGRLLLVQIPTQTAIN